MARGNITKRGKSWRLKFDIEPLDGKRRFRTVTIRGSRKDAEAELAKLLNDAHKGTLVDASKVTVGDYLLSWLDGRHGLAPLSVQQYRDIIERQTNPVLGKIELQKLKPVQVQNWLGGLLKSGLSVRSVRQAHGVLRSALQNAVQMELLIRNVADIAKPPKVEANEVEILLPAQIAAILAALAGNSIHAIVALAIASGMRRGELLALRWSDISGAVIKVQRSLEQTKQGGLRFKGPKSRHGRRTISLPPSAVDMLRDHRKAQLELRMQLGMGKHGPDALVFCDHEGKPLSPNYLSILWRRATRPIGIDVQFHSLRHSHASALIAAGVDVVSVSRRLGHSSPAFTLTTYCHLFRKDDSHAADAIESMLG